MGLLGLLGFMGSFGSHGSHVSLGSPGPPGSLWSWVSLVSWVKCNTDSLNRSVKIIEIFYFRIFANDMAPCVKNVGGCTASAARA